MAAVQENPNPLPEELRELAESLTQDEVPTKLRCAICNLLAVNAFRLPCCDQNVCEHCQSTLTDTCPICAHVPLSPDAAKPQRVLRGTVNQWLKNLEKKREKLRAGVNVEPSSTPVTLAAQPTLAPIDPAQEPVESIEQPLTNGAEANDSQKSIEAVVPSVEFSAEKSADVLEPVEEIAEQATSTEIDAEERGERESSADSEETDIVTGDELMRDADGKIITRAQHQEYLETEEGQAWSMQNAEYQDHGMQNGADYSAFNGAQDSFPGMDFNSTDPAQMMQQMQMMMQQSAGWNGNANIMGMPAMSGMGMNPMDPSAMFGFGMQGMGGMNPAMMNMMSMNGMSGMNGMMGGMDFTGGFNAGWNNGQQQMNGGFGASSGFFPGGGFNQSHQGQFPQMSHHQQYPKNNFHNQNRFQGSQRGYGRGYHNQGNGQFHNQFQIQPSGPPPGAPKGPKAAMGFQTNGEAFHHQLPQKIQSRRASVEGMSIERQQQLALDAANQPRSHDAEDVTSISKDSLDPLMPSDTADGSVPTGNMANELIQQEGNVNTGAEARDDVPSQDTDLHTDHNDQQQLESVQDSPETAPTNGVDTVGSNRQIDGVSAQTNGYVQGDQFYPNRPQANNMRGRGDLRGGHRGGRGGLSNVSTWQYHGTRGPPTPQAEVRPQTPVEPNGTGVQGAPKGPKAMRDGLPNSGWSGRGRPGFGNQTRGAQVPVSPVVPTPTSDRAAGPIDITISERARSRSRSRSRSHSPSNRHRSRRNRSRTPSSDSEYERKREHRGRRSSRKHGDEVKDTHQSNSQDYEEERARDRSPRKDRHRSSKSHRDSSRRRHRHRSRSRSPARADHVDTIVNGDDKDKYREKYRDRSRDREREERDKDRRDRDRKRSRREGSESRDSDRHHSSRRDKKDKERDRNRERDGESVNGARTSQPQTPAEPEIEFKIQGRSKGRTQPPPSGPAAMQPPTGPRTLTPAQSQPKVKLTELRTKVTPTTRGARDTKESRSRLSHPQTPTSVTASSPPSPKNSAYVDTYQQEREQRIRDRVRKEEQRRATLQGSAAPSISRKRSFDDVTSSTPPTGPKDLVDQPGRRSRVADGRSAKSRRVSYQYEDAGRAERGESEREAARYR